MSRRKRLYLVRATQVNRVRVLAADRSSDRLGVTACLLLAALIALLLAPRVIWAADQKVAVLVNGCPQEFDPAAFSREGVSYVPLRQGVAAVGGTLKWDAVKSRAIITSGTKVAVVNKAQGLIVDGSMFIPLRMVGEALDCRVAWDGAAKTVRIETRPTTAPVPT